MTDTEIRAEIETCSRYLMESALEEDAKDSLRALLRAARSGDERGISVLLVCAEVRNRVRESSRIGAAAQQAAEAAVTRHAAECLAAAERVGPSRLPPDPPAGAVRLAAYVQAVRPAIRPVCWMLGVVGAAGQLPALQELIRSLLRSQG